MLTLVEFMHQGGREGGGSMRRRMGISAMRVQA